MTYYVATVNNEYEGCIRKSDTIHNLMKKINNEFGKGWKVEIWECDCEEAEFLATMYGTGKIVKEYTKRA